MSLAGDANGLQNVDTGVASVTFAPSAGLLAPVEKERTQSEVAAGITGALQGRDTAPQVRASEPDTRDDSVAHPRSERVSHSRPPVEDALAGYAAARGGPDSLLARRLRLQLDRVPQWEGDLVSERSAWALARVRDGRIIEPMIDEMKNVDWRVRAYAAWVLEGAGASAMRDPRATDELVAALSHPVWRLRAMAAHALAAIGDPAVRTAMQGALNDEAWQVRLGAVQYVARLGDPTLLAELERLTRDRHIAVRGAASDALATLSTKRL